MVSMWLDGMIAMLRIIFGYLNERRHDITKVVSIVMASVKAAFRYI